MEGSKEAMRTTDNPKILPPNYIIQQFPKVESAVYVLIYKKKDTSIPFYVGETDNFYVRMRDYMLPQLAASTDFKVGEAVKYFRAKGMEIEVAVCKDISDKDKRRDEERNMCEVLRHHGYRLLNDLKGYNYKIANRQDERDRVWQFCDEALKTVGGEIG